MKKVYAYYFKPANKTSKTFIDLVDDYEWYVSQFFTSKMVGISVPKCNFFAKWILFT